MNKEQIKIAEKMRIKYEERQANIKPEYVKAHECQELRRLRQKVAEVLILTGSSDYRDAIIRIQKIFLGDYAT